MKKIISMFSTVSLVCMSFVGAFTVVPTTTFAATPFSNGSFESGTAPGAYLTVNSVDNTTITDWTVDSGSVDYIGSYWQSSPVGGRSIDLNGLAQGSISQTITTVVGATYDVTFDLSGNPDSRLSEDPLYSPADKVVKISATGATDGTFNFDTSVENNSLANMMWKSHTYTFTATTNSTTLTFSSQIAGAFGPALDNVAVTERAPTCNANAMQTIVSDTTNNVTGPDVSGSVPAVATWVHSAWASAPALGSGATWIWDATQVTAPTTDQTSVFTKTFNVVGSVTSAGIDIAADNGYILKVNGTVVTDQSAIETNYSATVHYNLSSYVVSGSNAIEVTVKNFALANSAYDTNPAGLLYKLTINNDECVTPPSPVVCPAGTTQSTESVDTLSVDSHSYSPTTSHIGLANGQSYILVASGTWVNSNNLSDSEYITKDGWTTYADGYNINPYFLGADSFDLQVDNAFINWGAYNGEHTYNYLYTGTGGPASFLIFDGDSSQPTPDTSWYGDNSGSLSVAIYACVPNIPTVTTGTISGQKFNDKNRNGQKDAGEEGLAGWTIRLLLDGPNDSDTLVASVVTDQDGNYTFTNVAPGLYDVRETHQKGWKRQTKNPQDISIVAGSNVANVNFGNATTKKGEKGDTDKDDNRDDQHGTYYANHGKSDYSHDKDNKNHQQSDNSDQHGSTNNHH